VAGQQHDAWQHRYTTLNSLSTAPSSGNAQPGLQKAMSSRQFEAATL